MRRLSSIYPEFEDKVEFYGVGFDPLESFDEIESMKKSQGYVYETAIPVGRVIPTLNVTRQSSKMAIDGNGVITYRDGYSGGSDEVWRRVLSALASGR